jgi:hypothetical protein
MPPSNQKASDEAVRLSYERTGSIPKSAIELGISGPAVYMRLVKLKIRRNKQNFSDAERQNILIKYQAHADAGTLSELAKSMGRGKSHIVAVAKNLGLTDRKRKRPYFVGNSPEYLIEWHKTNPHPMIGKTIKPETADRISKGLKKFYCSEGARQALSDRALKRWLNRTPEQRAAFAGGPKSPWKKGWRTIGGINKFYRSRWEANYARYLQWLKEQGQITDWAHEPTTFWFHEIKRGCRSYLPDFAVTELNGSVDYHEVKGWMDARSQTKIKRMAKYYPNIKLIVIRESDYNSISKKVGRMVPDWE